MNNIQTALEELDRLFPYPHPGKALFRPGYENIGENPKIERLFPQIAEAARQGQEKLEQYLDKNEGGVDFVAWHMYMLSGQALAYIFPKIVRSFVHLDMNNRFDSSGPLFSSLLKFKHGDDERLTLNDRQCGVLSKILEIHFLEKFENHGFDARLFSFMALFNQNLFFFQEAFDRNCNAETRASFAQYMVEMIEAGGRGASILLSVAERAFIFSKADCAHYCGILKEKEGALKDILLGARARNYIDNWLAG